MKIGSAIFYLRISLITNFNIMKKIIPISIIVILLIAVACAVIGDLKKAEELEVVEDGIIEEVDKSTVTYSNSYYNFSLELPEGLVYCLNDFCFDNNIKDKNIQYLKITTYDFLKYQNIEINSNTLTYPFLEIRPRKNSLGMSAIDFAKRSLELNREYRLDQEYSQEEEIIFAGEDTYTFIAEKGFEERGGLSTDDGLKDNPDSFEKAGQGYLLGASHRIIYLDYNGFIYRIIYPIENEIAEGIIDSFKFIN